MDFLKVSDARVDKKPDLLDKADRIYLSCLVFSKGEMLNQLERQVLGCKDCAKWVSQKSVLEVMLLHIFNGLGTKHRNY